MGRTLPSDACDSHLVFAPVFLITARPALRVGWVFGGGRVPRASKEKYRSSKLPRSKIKAEVQAEVSFEWMGVFGEERLSVFIGCWRGLGGWGCSHQVLEDFLLVLLGPVIQQDPDDHQDCPDGREAGDLVPKDNDAEPNGQGVLHRAGNTGEGQENRRGLRKLGVISRSGGA